MGVIDEFFGILGDFFGNVYLREGVYGKGDCGKGIFLELFILRGLVFFLVFRYFFFRISWCT